MSEEVEDVRAALRERFGDNEKEIDLMLSRYVGQHRTIRSFFRLWLEERLREQASWMMNYINVEVIADAAVAMAAWSPYPQSRRGSFGGVYTYSSPGRSRRRSGAGTFAREPMLAGELVG